MSATEKKQNRKTVLRDHQRIGKRLIPPLAQLNLSEVSWMDLILPELIWLGVLNNIYGRVKGAELAITLPKIATSVGRETDKNEWFISVSCFSNLSKQQGQDVVELLTASGQIEPYRKAFSTLVNYYPECPLGFLFNSENPRMESPNKDLQHFKQLLNRLFDRKSVDATFVQANAIYIAFVLDKLKVSKNLTLAEFPKIQDYPNTEISKRIASSVRATINIIFGGDILETTTFWPKYFWNRGLQIEPCYFD
jgi:hypothetical protein